jgi:hypothetical protein
MTDMSTEGRADIYACNQRFQKILPSTIFTLRCNTLCQLYKPSTYAISFWRYMRSANLGAYPPDPEMHEFRFRSNYRNASLDRLASGIWHPILLLMP